MPELGWFWGYPFAIGLMVAVGAGMIVLFKRRGWLPRSTGGSDRAASPDRDR
jgi:hypothetical protein